MYHWEVINYGAWVRKSRNIVGQNSAHNMILNRSLFYLFKVMQ